MAAELAAVSFAFYNVYGQHLVQIYPRWTVLVYSLFGAAVFWQVVNPPWKIVAQHYSGAQWLFVVLLGSKLPQLTPVRTGTPGFCTAHWFRLLGKLFAPKTTGGVPDT